MSANVAWEIYNPRTKNIVGKPLEQALATLLRVYADW